jgi:hypothetical protein
VTTHIVETPTHVFEIEVTANPDRPGAYTGNATRLSGKVLTDDEMGAAVMPLVFALATSLYSKTNDPN